MEQLHFIWLLNMVSNKIIGNINLIFELQNEFFRLGCKEILEILVKNGANLSAADIDGKTALDRAFNEHGKKSNF